MSEPVLSCRDLGKHFRDGDHEIHVLSGVEFCLAGGERVAIVGRSGSGKSTLLNLLGGLDVPTAGEIRIAGRNVASLSERDRCGWRNQQLGFVFQFHHLLPEFTALEAVAMPARIAGRARAEAQAAAELLLSQVGLEHRLNHRPAALSGGERQRVAIARALVNNPSCVLMDEPTGNLDPESAEQVLGLMTAMERTNTAFVVVTHDPKVAARMDRQLELVNGQLVEH